jgi:hypothetical protein
MNADHRHDTPDPTPRTDRTDQDHQLPKHPFTAAWETWQAWSMANTMRQAHKVAREQGDLETLASFARYPQWTQGPGPLEALAANRQVVDFLLGWRWQAMREAREQGHGWGEIGTALQVDGDQAKRGYLETVDRQRLAGEHDPDLARLLRYDPRWRELADDNDADRADHAELERRALAHHDPGCPPDWPRDNGRRQDGHER